VFEELTFEVDVDGRKYTARVEVNHRRKIWVLQYIKDMQGDVVDEEAEWEKVYAQIQRHMQ
jgi:hypothetical protein